MRYTDKKYVIAVLTAVNLALFVPYGSPGEDRVNLHLELSLRDAVTIAFKNNKEIQIQEMEIEAAKAGKLGAISQFLPKLNLNSGYTRNGTVLRIATQGAKKDAGIFSGYKNDNSASLTLSQPIYNGGANIANLKEAQLEVLVQGQTLRACKLDVEFETKRLYYGLLLAYETERIAHNLVNQAQSHYEDTANKFKQGTVSRFDVLSSKVQLSKVMPGLLEAKNSVELILAELKKLLGLKMQDSIKPKDLLEYSLIEIKEGEFLKQAYLSKPDLILKSLGIDIGRWSIEMAKAGNRPLLNAEAGYSYRSNNTAEMFNNRHNNWNAGVSITIPIFDGFASKAKVDEAKARYAKANLEKENLSEEIAVDIRKACLDLNQAKAIIDTSKEAIEEAKEALRLAQVRFDNGEGTNLEILDAQVSLSQIEQNYSSAIYDYLMAQAFLFRSMGSEFLQEAKNEKKD